MKRPKISVLLFLPILGLLLPAFIVAFYDPFSLFQNPFDHIVGGDFVGIYAEEQLNAEIEYNAEWKEKTQEEFQALSRLFIKVIGPFDGPLKILVPIDVVVEAKDTIQEETFENLHAFSTELKLAPHEERILKFRYRLTPQSSPYFLKLSSNKKTIYYNIREKFPEYLELQSNEWKLKTHEISWEGKLKNPFTLRLDWKRTNKPLYLIEAKFTQLHMIEILFNRNLSSTSASDGLNFSINDINEKNSEITDRVFIEKVDVKDKKIFLTLRGVTLQRGERYRLIIKNIKDVNGNFIEPNPTVITVTLPKEL